MDEQGVCEHCRINILVSGLYGRFRTYTCARDIKIGELMVGADTPCKGHHQPSCYSSVEQSFEKRHSSAKKFRFKMIPLSEMKKSEDCLAEEEKEKEDKKNEISKLRIQAGFLTSKARRLEKEIEEESGTT